MSFFRSLCSVTPAGIGGFLYESFTNQWQRNLLTVKAYSDESNSPNCPNIEDYLPDDENQPIEPVYQLNDSWEEEELEGENSIEDAINQWNFEHSDDEDQSDQSDHEFNNNDDNLENGNIWGNIVVDENAFNEFLNHAQNGQNEEIIADLHVLPEHDEYHDVSQNLAENDEFGDDENNIFLLEGAEFENAVNKAFVAEGNDQCARQNDGGNGDNIWVDRVHQEVSAECPQVCGPVSDDYDVDERSYLGYGNCLVHYNCNSKTIYWTVENLTDENVGESEHRHCEFLRIQPGVTECDESQACGNDNRHDIAFLPQAADNGNAAGSQDCSCCCYCRDSTIWNVFHQYYRFLLARCTNEVTVCSGTMCTPEPCDNLEYTPVNGNPIPNATHFFKIIISGNNDGTYGLECYKFRTGPMCIERPLICNSIVPRHELERDAGFSIYRHINPCSISRTATHPEFVPN